MCYDCRSSFQFTTRPSTSLCLHEEQLFNKHSPFINECVLYVSLLKAISWTYYNLTLSNIPNSRWWFRDASTSVINVQYSNLVCIVVYIGYLLDTNPQLVERTLTQTLNQLSAPWPKPSTNRAHLNPKPSNNPSHLDSNPQPVECNLTQTLNQSSASWLKPSTNRAHLDPNPQPVERTLNQTLNQSTAPWLKPSTT